MIEKAIDSMLEDLDPYTTFNNLYSDGSQTKNNKKKNKK